MRFPDGVVINGAAHGPQKGITTCQLYMREFQDGAKITIEPFKAKAFPVVKDLIVGRSAFDRIQQGGRLYFCENGERSGGQLPSC